MSFPFLFRRMYRCKANLTQDHQCQDARKSVASFPLYCLDQLCSQEEGKQWGPAVMRCFPLWVPQRGQSSGGEVGTLVLPLAREGRQGKTGRCGVGGSCLPGPWPEAFSAFFGKRMAISYCIPGQCEYPLRLFWAENQQVSHILGESAQ